MAPPFLYAGEAFALASSLLWASAGVLFARIRPPLAAGAMNLGKNLTGLLGFAVVFLVINGRPWPKDVPLEGVLLFGASGFVGLTLCDTLFMRALLTIGPQRAALFMAISPVLTALVALFPPFRETPTALSWAGMCLCVLGISFAALRRAPDPVQAAVLRRGARDALLAGVLQTAGVLLSRLAFARTEASAADASQIRLFVGVLGLLVLGGVVGATGTWVRQLTSHGAWRKLGLAAAVGTFLGIWAHNAAIAWVVNTGVGTTLNSLAPVFLIPLSAAFLGERPDARAWTSTLLAVGGIALIALARGG